MKHKGHPLYRTWCGMRDRCNNPRKDNYYRYGALGISIAPEWNDFKTFAADMGPKPQGTTLDRKDNGGPYSKENCRWSSHIEQANNKSNNLWVEHGDERLTISDWARKIGMEKRTLWHRLKRGWPVEKALTCPVQ